MNKLRYLIIDDERPNRVLLRTLLADHAEGLELLAEADGGLPAVELIEELKPDVIFLDIQMPDLNGFEVLARIRHMPRVVFVTAFDQYALKAFEENTVDYLVKPVEEQRLARTVKKLLAAPAAAPAAELDQLKKLLQGLQPRQATRSSLAVRSGNRILMVALDDVAYFEGKEKYVALHTLDGKEYLLDQTLSALEEQVSESFLRIQKSYIINTSCIGEIHKHLNNRLLFRLKDKAGSELLSGTSYIHSIRERLGL